MYRCIPCFEYEIKIIILLLSYTKGIKLHTYYINRLPTNRFNSIHLGHNSIQSGSIQMNTILLCIDSVPTYLCLTLKNSNVCLVNFLNNMRYRQQKRKSQGFRLKICCNVYILLEIQSFHDC